MKHISVFEKFKNMFFGFLYLPYELNKSQQPPTGPNFTNPLRNGKPESLNIDMGMTKLFKI
jgi:hypothetical protein